MSEIPSKLSAEKVQKIISCCSELEASFYSVKNENSVMQREINQQECRKNELAIRKAILLQSLERVKEEAIQENDKQNDNEYKEKLQTLLNQINCSENESIQLVSISSSQLVANYFIFKPNKLKNTKVLELELTFDTSNFKIKNVLNKQTNQYLTQNELSLTLANLASLDNFLSKSLFFHSNSLKAVHN